MIKLVIFDWDGTLYDTLPKICTAMLEAGRRAGAASKSVEDVRGIVGLSLELAIETIWPNESERVRADIREHYKVIYVASDQSPPSCYEGALELIEWLRVQGIMTAVATGKSRRGLDRVMGLAKVDHLFDVTRCADETKSKPDPQMLQEILTELDVDRENALMIGDTTYDLEMARNAGMRSVGVEYGAHHASRFEEYAPLAVVSRLDQLKDILEWK